MSIPKWIGDLIAHRKADKARADDIRKKKDAIRERVEGLVEEEFRKQEQYRSLVKTELNYPIIQDLINSAQQGVDVVISFPGGQVMKMSKTVPADALARMRSFGELY
jgi:hypothetical protein